MLIRAWHKSQKKMFSPEEMADDQLTLLPTGQFINVHGSHTRLSQIMYDMIPMLCTGRGDMHGRLIFEGDIVKVRSCRLEDVYPAALVEWDHGRWGFTVRAGVQEFTTSNSFEIIGNIYENPDLLIS